MHPKQHISQLPQIIKQKGVEQIVISPGSRNAPLIKIFHETFGENCISIVDERSAGFFALGLSIRSQKPVVVLSTSGTAVLNYGPALAEAYYQAVPLIAITADRPAEWIDQQDNQTIRQKNIFSNYSKYSCELPVVCTIDDDIWYSNRLINEAFNHAVSGKPGPVQINVPLREPLYDELPIGESVREISIAQIESVRLSNHIIEKWNKSNRILVVCGQMKPDTELLELINRIASFGKAVVLAEAVSNIKGEKIINKPDLLLASQGTDIEKLKPELVVYCGGQVISKRLKSFLRSQKDAEFWFVDASAGHIDTFRNLSTIIPVSPKLFFKEIVRNMPEKINMDFTSIWQKSNDTLKEKFNNLLPIVENSDLMVFQRLSGFIAEKDIVFAGNSSVIRYLQMFDFNGQTIYSNRGTSGIDGCLSTASGIAQNSEETVFAVLGDLSFIYDSNGLWNKNLPKNLKIIVINNSGGGIFGMLEGPSSHDFYDEFLVAHHPVDISKLCSAFGVIHYTNSDNEQIETVFKRFKLEPKPALLEIKTPAERNPEIFRNFINKISKQK
jgi:2-succinyl-5-enolpyruvyl-6-hydroxy-3-cyclohexene-1-carboxylate synthase